MFPNEKNYNIYFKEIIPHIIIIIIVLIEIAIGNN